MTKYCLESEQKQHHNTQQILRLHNRDILMTDKNMTITDKTQLQSTGKGTLVQIVYSQLKEYRHHQLTEIRPLQPFFNKKNKQIWTIPNRAQHASM